MTTDLTRREAIGFALAGALAPTAVAAAARRRPLLRGGSFAQGVAAAPGSIWTRLDGLGAGQSGYLSYEVARDRDFRRVVRQGRALVGPKGDHHARVSMGLKAGEEYWYRFATRTRESPVGRLRMPRPPDSAEPVRIGFFSCQRRTEGTYAAHAGLAAEDLDLVVSLGDYIYERSDEGEAATLDEYRRTYRLYKSDPLLQAMHAAHPLLAAWDDHEVASNYEGATGPSPDRVPFPQRRRNAYRAFREHMPFAPRRGDRTRTYRSLRLGTQADLLVLDTRQYRDRAAGTMLGDRQREWLLHRLTASRATWKIVANQTMCMANDLTPGNSGDLDGWDGYAGERRLLLDTLRERGVTNVVLATGDEHEFYAGQLSPSGRTDTPPVATEVVTGAISSGARPPGLERQQSALEAKAQQLANPHWVLADGEHNGYGVFEARPDRLTAVLRGPQEVQDPASATTTFASLRVDAGEPRIELR